LWLVLVFDVPSLAIAAAGWPRAAIAWQTAVYILAVANLGRLGATETPSHA
jgi:hypothetical protein